MGMCAEIIAIGPFSKEIIGFLDYRPDLYATTAEGSMISRRLFGISEGSSLSSEFAELLGVRDAWDFNQHKIENGKIDFVGLKRFCEIYDHYADDVNALEVLAKSGFEMHFRPEG